jgi:hypothetical protein
MKLLFSKTDLHGQWFRDNETPENFTEKIPPSTMYEFNEESNDWVLKPVEIEEEESTTKIEEE